MAKIQKTQRQSVYLKQGIFILLILGALYLLIINPFLKEGRSLLDEELEKRLKDVKRFIRESGTMPSKEYFLKLESENKELEESFLRFKNFIDAKVSNVSLEDSAEVGLYFTERLHELAKRIGGLSNEKGIKVPENLGFSESLPKETLVPILLRQLEMVELACDTLLKEGTDEISSLKPLKPIDHIDPKTGKLFLKEVPVQIGLRCNTPAFVKFLIKLRESSPVIAVTEMHVKSDEEAGVIEANLIFSSFMFEG